MWLCEHTILFAVEIIYCLIKIIRYTFFAGWGGGEVKSQWLANNNSITATINLSSVWAFSDSYQLKIVEPQEHSSLSLKRIVFLNSKNFSWYAGNLYYCWATNLQWSARYNFFRWVIAFDPIFFLWQYNRQNERVFRSTTKSAAVLLATNHILPTHGKDFSCAIEVTT